MSSNRLSGRSEPGFGGSGEGAVHPSAIRAELKIVVSSRVFSGSKRSQDFLKLIVEHALAGHLDNLSERMIGTEMFGRPIDYDTSNDAVVRVQATVVRRKLAQYYAELAEPPLVSIGLPVGSYIPIFRYARPPDADYIANQGNVSPSASPMDVGQAVGGDSRADSGRAKTKLLSIFGAIFVGLTMISLIAYIFHRRPNTIHTIAVLPLENLSGGSDQDYFAEGVTGELIADLGQISSLRVISKTSSLTYKGTKKTLPEIARELNVDAVVEGSVLREKNKVRITVALISAQTDQYLWGKDYVGDLTDVLSLQGDLAQSIANEIHTRVTPEEQRRLKHSYSLVPEAQDQYLVGSYMLNSGDPQNAISSLQHSVDLDPNYAPAQAALANAYGWLGSAGWLPYTEAFQKQRDAALRAIEIDDSLSEGHAELADAVMNLNWDWHLADRELARALELNPNSNSSHLARALFTARIGQFPIAINEIKHSLELDPVSSRSLKSAALVYYYGRHYEEALKAVRRASVLESSPSSVSFAMGVIYTEEGRYKQAIEQFNLRRENPHTLGHLGNAYARSRDVPNALKTIKSLKKYVEKENIGRYEIAIVYAGLGNREQAFSWLDKAFDAHDKGMTFLNIDPCLDPVRSGPRLEELSTGTGLPR